MTTVGHGTLQAEEFAELLVGSGVAALIDVRSHPGSRRNPHFARERMEEWVPAAGPSYRWEPELGGRRRTRPDSPNIALRHPAFRGYADHMADPAFAEALDRLVAEAGSGPVAVMCSETLWWRCHRRLLADALVLWKGCPVRHLMHDGRLQAHRLTEGVRGQPGDPPRYDVGVTGQLDL